MNKILTGLEQKAKKNLRKIEKNSIRKIDDIFTSFFLHAHLNDKLHDRINICPFLRLHLKQIVRHAMQLIIMRSTFHLFIFLPLCFFRLEIYESSKSLTSCTTLGLVAGFIMISLHFAGFIMISCWSGIHKNLAPERDPKISRTGAGSK